MAVLCVGGANVAVTSVHGAGVMTSFSGTGEYKHIELWHLALYYTSHRMITAKSSSYGRPI